MSATVAFARGLDKHPEGLPVFEYAWLEAPRAAKLAWLAETEDWQNLEEWPQGRIFGGAGEYRWRRDADDTLHGVLILEQGEHPAAFEGRLTLADPDDRSLLLWGEWVDPDADADTNPNGDPVYYTPDLPRAQAYPLEKGPSFSGDARPCLKVRTYRSAEGSFQRAVAVELCEMKDEEKEHKGENDA